MSISSRTIIVITIFIGRNDRSADGLPAASSISVSGRVERPLSHRRPVTSGPVGLAQVALEDLAGGVARERLDDIHALRALVVREVLAAERDQLLLGGGDVRFQGHDALDRLTPAVVGYADDGDLCDRRVFGQHSLDL